jgi:hypothetical protein
VRQIIRAYHGSPHNFDKFDASKIGSGEGMQSFGHGLYFAGSENVAENYRNILSGRRPVLIGGEDASELYSSIKDGPAFGTPRSAESEAVRAIAGAGFGAASADDVIRNARTILSDSPDPAVVSERLLALDRIAGRGIGLGKPPGHMYEVQIDHPESALLDLDMPVKSQPRLIQEALGEHGEAPKWFSLGSDGWRGDHAYTRMASALAGENPRIVDGYHVTHDKPAASAALLRAGVPGLRYFDGHTRGMTEGTRNYVMFPGTEDSIRILRKYGLMAPIAASQYGENDGR